MGWLQFRVTWSTVLALWEREMRRLFREPTRWVGVVGQPLVFWLLLGTGMQSVFVIPGSEPLRYFLPGMVAMCLLFTALFATMSIIEDRQSGFLQAVLVAPAPRWALVLGKILGVSTLGLMQVVAFLAVAWAIGPAFSISFAPLFLTVLVSMVGLVAMHFAIAWILNSVQAYHGIMSVVLLPLWLVSGALFPVPSAMWLQIIMMLNPMFYVVAALRAALVGEIPPYPLAISLSVLSGFACVACALAVWVCRRRANLTLS